MSCTAGRLVELMYSSKLANLFKEKRVAIGDTIRVEKADFAIEGELMPNTEAGSDSSIIVKMKSGYNAGILFDDKVRLEKVSGRKTKSEFPFAKPKADSKLPKVVIIWTGGTIGSKVAYGEGGVESTVKPEELFYYVPELPEIANISMNHLFSVWSQDLTYTEWQKLADAVAKEINAGARGVVITHGTDTMHYTAAALSFMLKNLNAPVVLTGSQRSSDRGSSDAFLNLIAATRIAAGSDIAEVGICMHASSSDDKMAFIRGTKARKMHTSRRDAFRAINDKPIAYVTLDGKIAYVGDYRKIGKSSAKVRAETKFEPLVALLKTHPNSDPEVMQYYLEKGYRGFIIEGTGLGHTPIDVAHEGRSWLPHIKSAIGESAVVGMTSQTIYGRVHPNVYAPLRVLNNAGVVFCEDMTPETAYVKLGWLLGNYDNERAKELLNKNIAGEINDRITYDEFLL